MSDPVFKDRPQHSKDPLKDGPLDARMLLSEFGRVAKGVPFDTVLNAAANVLISALRQECKSRAEAEKKFDEMMGRTKTALLNHYDSATGKRRSIFAFDQTVNVDFDRIMSELKTGSRVN